MSIEAFKSEVEIVNVAYQARTALADLANKIASIRRLDAPDTIVLIKKAAKIRYWLKALDIRAYLTVQQTNQIVYKLIEISGIDDAPTAPVLVEFDNNYITWDNG